MAPWITVQIGSSVLRKAYRTELTSMGVAPNRAALHREDIVKCTVLGFIKKLWTGIPYLCRVFGAAA